MARSNLLGGALSFAHLLGRGTPDAASTPAPNAAKAEDDDDEPDDKRDDETDEEYRERKRREREREKDDDEDGKKAKSKSDEDEDKTKAARMQERARCAAIFASPHAAARPDMAAHLAFATELSAKDAKNTLAAIAAGQPQATAPKNGLRSRMEGQRSPDLGNADAESGGQADNSPDAVARRSLAAAGIAVPAGAVRTLPATN